jgi:hypothetical protein
LIRNRCECAARVAELERRIDAGWAYAVEEAPANGQLYTRNGLNFTWVPSPVGGPKFVASYDAVLDACTFTALLGLANGPLPATGAAVANSYVVVDVPGTPPAGPMAGVAHSNGDWIACDNQGTAWAHLTSGAPAAMRTEAPTDGWRDVQS